MVANCSIIRSRLFAVEEKISEAAKKRGLLKEDITILASVKYADVEQINELVRMGIIDLGENRAQRLKEIHPKFNSSVRWHFIGHLQKNKVKIVVERADLIQSVDSYELALEINNQSNRLDKVQDVLVQLKISSEENKFGVPEAGLERLINGITSLDNINICGLMAIAPITVDNDVIRSSFKKAAEYYKKLEGLLGYKPKLLSMGMSNDYEIAIEEGSNMVRLGSVLLEG